MDLIYLFAVLVPEWMGGRTARKLGGAAQKALDPERDYRAAKLAHRPCRDRRRHAGDRGFRAPSRRTV